MRYINLRFTYLLTYTKMVGKFFSLHACRIWRNGKRYRVGPVTLMSVRPSVCLSVPSCICLNGLASGRPVCLSDRGMRHVFKPTYHVQHGRGQRIRVGLE